MSLVESMICLQLHEIKEVREAYIVPINDHYMGNVPVAWIVSDPGSSLTKEMISDHVRLSMTSQKVPRRVYFCTSDDLPRTPIGKVKKKDLADMTKRKIEKLPDSGLISREMAK
jgi:acyl-CoA synthetase (AMP-forming)/AMP-acid ligase II